ncbi:hypothetical protein CAPI_08705 [Corynebacterium capitovis DSM 44611]|uniref:three-helix bundle dimerization domain-containing protein n=1 Tax=Corynebacterium capitovis TaxID=131081 RepID=UPI00036AB799|nr:hypothetical protein [Corynebacterium capitovis]WKD58267.1 hypothetical protein CAPI_08705 [Corynebacterium capitovis DSM 44611]
MTNTKNKNKIDFSIIRERALRNIREDLISNWSDRYSAKKISDTFHNELATHRRRAAVDDFVPILVEAAMLNRLRGGSL